MLMATAIPNLEDVFDSTRTAIPDGAGGATGKTGRLVLERALEAGHQVRALVRDPARLTITSDRLVVATGEVLDAESVDQTVRGTEVVLRLFGQVRGSPKTLQTDGTRLIVESMLRHNVKRLVTLSGGALWDEHDRPKVADRMIMFLLKVMAGHVLADAKGHLAILEASGFLLPDRRPRDPIRTPVPAVRYRLCGR